MKEVFPERDFDEMEVICPNCGWSGVGSDTIIIDLYGLSKIREVHCPSCDTYIAGLFRENTRSNPEGDELSNQFG
jgi:hypothetical protein